ncbi:YheU family protein [Pseudobdellovibrio sp. HCB154]|uniref:YheU family protein n=1 Tax=Pseudobdellovibrio sp. HCB154 TaxID=3386277 RepID=UPI0039173C1D
MNPENSPEILPPIEVPREKLSPEIIDALIEEFVLREGTDYGAVEISLQKKKEQVEKQLLKNDIKIVFDFTAGSATLMTAQQFKRLALQKTS